MRRTLPAVAGAEDGGGGLSKLQQAKGHTVWKPKKRETARYFTSKTGIRGNLKGKAIWDKQVVARS